MVKKVLLIIFGAVLLIGILLYLLGAGLCNTQYSSNKIFSPDGEYFVQIQDESCGGAVGDYTTGVIISNAKSFFSKFDFLAANILNAQMENRKGVLGAHGSGSSIKISWVDNRTVKVSLSDCGPIIGKRTSWKDIKIVYEGSCSEQN